MVTRKQIGEILTGWSNVFLQEFDLLNPVTKAEAERRLKICDTCPFRVNRVCSKMKEGKNIITNEVVTGCGCNIKAKTVSPKSVCPAGKW